MAVSLNGDMEILTVSFSPPFSSASRLSAALSGSLPFHVPAERRGLDPSRVSPLGPQSSIIQLIQPREYVLHGGSQQELHHHPAVFILFARYNSKLQGSL